MSIKVLITGGAGFIGSALGKVMIDNHRAEVTAVDCLLDQVHPTGKPPTSFDPRIRLVHQDVRDREAWRALFAEYQPDYIAHFAAETGTAQSLTDSARHSSVNVLGTSELLDALCATGQTPKKILLSSSRSVYGEGAWRTASGQIFYPGRRSHKQMASAQWDFIGKNGEAALPLPHQAGATFANPSSIYAATKLAQENILGSWCEAFNVPLSILRFQNVYGPGQSPANPYTGIINIFHRVAASGGVIDVYEDGQIGRDFVFVDDVVRSCEKALLDPCSETFFGDIGFGEPTTILQAAQIIAHAYGAPAPVISGKFRDGDVRWAVADTKVMVNDLGVKPTINFAEGSRRVGDWLRSTGHLG